LVVFVLFWLMFDEQHLAFRLAIMSVNVCINLDKAGIVRIIMAPGQVVPNSECADVVPITVGLDPWYVHPV